jgi:DNA-binding NtrC family response regulator
MSRVLVVEDDALFRRALEDALGDVGVEVVGTPSVKDARAELARRARFALALVDQYVADGTALDLLPDLRTEGRAMPVVFLTAEPSVESAIAALRYGVVDYLIKPIDLDALSRAIVDILAAEGAAVGGEAPAAVADVVARAARVRAPVLLIGETGTGKSRLARQIHDDGPGGPFVPVNCAALPPSLIEAELFGTEAGAFTGARERPGLFEQADGGTLFLDEIGELPLALQAKLLHVLESGEARRVGGVVPRRFSVRVIAATQRPLDEEERTGRFRTDLRYRLDVLRLELPRLRDRDDLEALCRAFLKELAPGRSIALPEVELARLRAHDWPGNLRELRNVLERALVFADGDTLTPSRFLRRPAPEADGELESLEVVVRAHILETLARHGGRRDRTARQLGISPATLRRKLAQFRRAGYGAQIDRCERSS